VVVENEILRRRGSLRRSSRLFVALWLIANRKMFHSQTRNKKYLLVIFPVVAKIFGLLKDPVLVLFLFETHRMMGSPILWSCYRKIVLQWNFMVYGNFTLDFYAIFLWYLLSISFNFGCEFSKVLYMNPLGYYGEVLIHHNSEGNNINITKGSHEDGSRSFH